MSTFEIPDAPTIVDLERRGPSGRAVGAIVFNVTNTSQEACGGRLGTVIAGDSKRDWFTVDGERERMFGPGETHTATVRIDVPPDVPAGSYSFRLRVVHVNDPDNDYAEGPMTAAKVPATMPPPTEVPTRKRPLALTIVGWLLVALGVGLTFSPFLLGGLGPLSLAGLVIIGSGYGVLKGHNWGRFLLIGCGLVVLGMSFASGAALVALFYSLVLAVIAFFLFRPQANAWFRSPSKAAA